MHADRVPLTVRSLANILTSRRTRFDISYSAAPAAALTCTYATRSCERRIGPRVRVAGEEEEHVAELERAYVAQPHVAIGTQVAACHDIRRRVAQSASTKPTLEAPSTSACGSCLPA